MKIIRSLASAIIFCIASAAQAQVFVEASAGGSKLDTQCAPGAYQCENTSQGYKFVLGYQFNKNFHVGLSTISWGTPSIAVYTDGRFVSATFNARSTAVTVMGNAQVGESTSVQARAGFARSTVSYDGVIDRYLVAGSASESYPVIGVSAYYNVSRDFALGLHHDRSYVFPKEFKMSVSLTSIGLRYVF